MYFATAAAVLAFLLYADVVQGMHPIVIVYLFASCAAIGTYVWTRRSRWQDRAQDYRALEFGLSVQQAWDAAGLGESVADYYRADDNHLERFRWPGRGRDSLCLEILGQVFTPNLQRASVTTSLRKPRRPLPKRSLPSTVMNRGSMQQARRAWSKTRKKGYDAQPVDAAQHRPAFRVTSITCGGEAYALVPMRKRTLNAERTFTPVRSLPVRMMEHRKAMVSTSQTVT
jgi:hypothetical protein